MDEKSIPSCRYGHGEMQSLTRISEDGRKLKAFGLFGIALSIATMNAQSGGPPTIGFEQDPLGGYVVQLFKCAHCGYIEMSELMNEEVVDALSKQ